MFISDYAQSDPLYEDLPETFLLYLALRYREDRLPRGMADIIERAIPNRIAVLDALAFDGKWCPIVESDCPGP